MSNLVRFARCALFSAALATLALAAPAHAQSGGFQPRYQREDGGFQPRYQREDGFRPRYERGEDRRDFGAARAGGTGGQFDFYVLALSWSAGFCELGGAQKARRQCAEGSGAGFVVHGLWPQYERGFPSDCGAFDQPIPRNALEQTHGLFPDEGLARYEWRKHGTCSGKGPSEYFADVRRAREDVRIPDPFKTMRGDMRVAPMDILRAFQEANPRLRPGMAAVGCKAGVLQEVRVCFSKDLRDFRPCPEVARQSCRAREIRVPAPL